MGRDVLFLFILQKKKNYEEYTKKYNHEKKEQ